MHALPVPAVPGLGATAVTMPARWLARARMWRRALRLLAVGSEMSTRWQLVIPYWESGYT